MSCSSRLRNRCLMLVVWDFKLASALGDDYHVSGTFIRYLDNYQSAPEARDHIRHQKTKISSLVVNGRLIARIVILIEISTFSKTSLVLQRDLPCQRADNISRVLSGDVPVVTIGGNRYDPITPPQTSWTVDEQVLSCRT